ncbi:hypothetical protein Ocin01_04656 [Orchesella cincta]|uniref:Uncharacterized protein n=1 Tax=Orchesella cincta TaxID=48709 RepID=A0A1D2N9U9_ORCCI|nr:hypothetical protein Ocin01_04656 [Orchesella cincta]
MAKYIVFALLLAVVAVAFAEEKKGSEDLESAAGHYLGYGGLGHHGNGGLGHYGGHGYGHYGGIRGYGHGYGHGIGYVVIMVTDSEEDMEDMDMGMDIMEVWGIMDKFSRLP